MKKKAERIPVNSKERDEFKSKFGQNPECSIAKTADGKFYIYTHRARSQAFKKIIDIPQKDFDFICTTG